MRSVMDDIIIIISGLAIKVQTAYKDSPDNYRHIYISEEVEELRNLIDKFTKTLQEYHYQ